MTNLNIKMWEEPIYEIKLGGINGISFRVGQRFKIKKDSTEWRRITNIERDVITSPLSYSEKKDNDGDLVREYTYKEEEVFMIFSAPENDIKNIKLTKTDKGEAVYVSFDVE